MSDEPKKLRLRIKKAAKSLDFQEKVVPLQSQSGNISREFLNGGCSSVG